MTVLLYHLVKYKDDGRELVTLFEFFTIHATFPVINAWMSYYIAYEFLIIITKSCA